MSEENTGEGRAEDATVSTEPVDVPGEDELAAARRHVAQMERKVEKQRLNLASAEESLAAYVARLHALEGEG